MSAKHTPGPWFTDEKHYSDKHRYVMSEHAPFLGTVAVVALGFAEAEANARLIASAPVLLQALRSIAEESTDPGAVECAKEAIAKATRGTA